MSQARFSMHQAKRRSENSCSPSAIGIFSASATSLHSQIRSNSTGSSKNPYPYSSIIRPIRIEFFTSYELFESAYSVIESPKVFRTRGISASLLPGSESTFRFILPPSRYFTAFAPHPAPQRQPLILVIIPPPKNLPQMILQLPRILPHKKRQDGTEKQWVKLLHPRAIGHRNRLNPRLRSRPQQKRLPIP